MSDLMNLLRHDEPPAFRVEMPGGGSPFLLTADHAGRRLPAALGDLGVTPEDMERHIAWDIGIGEVTVRLARALDATAVLQTYSRLVIDCNRPPEVPSAIPVLSEATAIPGNFRLSKDEKLMRRRAIFDPYHAEIDRLIKARDGRPTIYVAMHSFTPNYLGVGRPMQVALLYHRNPALSHRLADLLRADDDLVVAENDPYSVGDASDYGVPVHAERRGLHYAEIEIRQDLITDEAGQAAWAARLARLLPLAADGLAGLNEKI